MKHFDPTKPIPLYLVRVNGALEHIFLDKIQAENYMCINRKNGQFWRIHEKATMPQETV